MPDIVEQTICANGGSPTELLDVESDSLNTVVVANEDGTNSVHIFPYDIKSADDGNLKFIENDVKSAPKQPLLDRLFGGVKESYEYQNTKDHIQTYFSKNPETGIKLTSGGYSVKLAPLLDSEKVPDIVGLIGHENEPVVQKPNSDLPIAKKPDLETETALGAEMKSNAAVTAAIDEDSASRTLMPNQTQVDIKQAPPEAYDKSQIDFRQETNCVAFDNVFTDSISLTYEPTYTGVKENIILKRYDGVNTFHFTLNTGGLVPELTAVRGASIPLLHPDTLDTVMVIGQIDATDAIYGTEEDDGTHFSLDHCMYLTSLEEASTYILTVVVDKKFLESPNTVYPVTIDPPVDVPASGIMDTPVYSGYANSNFNANYYHHVGYYNSTYKEGEFWVQMNCTSRYSYISPRNVVKATYNAYENSGKTHNANVQVFDTSVTWWYDELTYNNRPATYGNPVSTQAVSTPARYYQFTITSLFKDWLSYATNEGGWTENFGFAVKMNTSGVSSRCFNASNFSSNRPATITITYNEDASLANGAYYIRNVRSGKYLDAYNNMSNTVIQYPFHGALNHQWLVTRDSEGYYRIQTCYQAYINSGRKMLSCSETGSYPYVDLWHYTASLKTQQWRCVKNSDGSYRIINRFHTDNQNYSTALGMKNGSTTDYNPADLGPYNGNDGQKWVLEKVNFGNGGTYQPKGAGLPPNCMGYALKRNMEINLKINPFNNSNYTKDHVSGIESTLGDHVNYRPLRNCVDPVQNNEYRVAVRVPNGINGWNFHVIYQLSDGSWAGKNHNYASKLLGWGDPSSAPGMWENDLFPEWVGTVYYAVRPK